MILAFSSMDIFNEANIFPIFQTTKKSYIVDEIRQCQYVQYRRGTTGHGSLSSLYPASISGFSLWMAWRAVYEEVNDILKCLKSQQIERNQPKK